MGEMPLFDFKRFIIVCGHYGCGKTNFSINLAMYLADRGENVTLVDFDIVNPYFRSSDYTYLLEKNKIELIPLVYANSNLDLPAIDSKIYSVFSKEDEYTIFDVGGDDAGAKLLSRFSKDIKETNNYDLLYLINKYRPITSNSRETVKILNNIENTCNLKATAIVNNSNLKESTTAYDILDSKGYANEISKDTHLPILMTTALDNISDKLINDFKNIFKLSIYVKTPWHLD